MTSKNQWIRDLNGNVDKYNVYSTFILLYFLFIGYPNDVMVISSEEASRTHCYTGTLKGSKYLSNKCPILQRFSFFPGTFLFFIQILFFCCTIWYDLTRFKKNFRFFFFFRGYILKACRCVEFLYPLYETQRNPQRDWENIQNST